MSLAEVQHQPTAQGRLQRALRGARTPHAYVFHGPEGVGKEMLARAFAGVLLCPSPRERCGAGDGVEGTFEGVDGKFIDACGECEDCALVSSGNHPDFHSVYRELIKYHPDPAVRNRKALDLGVDVIREFLIGTAGRRPVRGRAKVYVVREAERMNVSAQNALLKTLEEPPPNTYIILLSGSAERLLPTTRSRSQLVPFGPLPVEFVRRRLLASYAELSEAEARFLAAVSEGRLGPALAAAADGLHHIKKPLLEATAGLQPGRALAWAKKVTEAGQILADSMSTRRSQASEVDLKRRALGLLLSALAYAFDDALRAHLQNTKGPAHADQVDEIHRLTRRLDAERAASAVQRMASAETHLNRNVNVALSLEGLAAELIGLLSSPAGSPPAP